MKSEKRIKVLQIVSDVEMSLQLKGLFIELNKGVDLRCILLNSKPSAFQACLLENGIETERIDGRFPSLMYQLARRMMQWRPDIVHTHLRKACLLGITTSAFVGIQRRIHTRHNSTFHLMYHPHAVYTDKWVSWLSTQIVSISDVVSDVLTTDEKTPARKIVKIHHGFDLSQFADISNERILTIKKKYNLKSDGIIVGMISRYIHWKGCQYGIEAFAEFHKAHPNAHLILANAVGPDSKEIKAIIKATLPKGSYTEILFEEDVAALYRTFDYFMHMPIERRFEAFGQTYVEALSIGVPSVFTLSGVAHEFIQDEKNALVVPYKDSQSIYKALERLHSDRDLCSRLKVNGQKDVQLFSLENQVTRMLQLYG